MPPLPQLQCLHAEPAVVCDSGWPVSSWCAWRLAVKLGREERCLAVRGGGNKTTHWGGRAPEQHSDNSGRGGLVHHVQRKFCPCGNICLLCMCRLLTGKALKPFVPQSTFLSLITTGDRYAVGTKGPFCLEVCLTFSSTLHFLPLSRILVLPRPITTQAGRLFPDKVRVHGHGHRWFVSVNARVKTSTAGAQMVGTSESWLPQQAWAQRLSPANTGRLAGT